MRKTDKAAKQNKPPKAKVEGGGIGALKPTKEEIAENRKVLKHAYRDWETDRKSTRLNSSHITRSRMPSSA